MLARSFIRNETGFIHKSRCEDGEWRVCIFSGACNRFSASCICVSWIICSRAVYSSLNLSLAMLAKNRFFHKTLFGPAWYITFKVNTSAGTRSDNKEEKHWRFLVVRPGLRWGIHLKGTGSTMYAFRLYWRHVFALVLSCERSRHREVHPNINLRTQ